MKPTEAQATFDAAARGWSFCDSTGLQRRLDALEILAKNLSSNDPRHTTLQAVRRAIGESKCGT